MNISKGREPLDQLDFIFLMKKLDLPVAVFVAGKYGILNGADPKPLVSGEQQKEKLLKRLFEVFEIDGQILDTDSLWSAPSYWNAVLKLSETEGIIEKSSGPPLSCLSAERLGLPAESSRVFSRVLSKLGTYPASSLYTLFEVAEAKYLKREFGIDTKIGPESEERYDRFIGDFMNIVQLYQPLDLRSSNAKPKVVIPYMERRNEERIFFDDTKDKLFDKLYKAAQRAEMQPCFWELDERKLPNPFMRTLMTAIEAAAIQNCLPMRLLNKNIYSSDEAMDFVEKSGARSLRNIAASVGEAIWNYVIRPFREDKIKYVEKKEYVVMSEVNL